jgi:hypothetical protein
VRRVVDWVCDEPSRAALTVFTVAFAFALVLIHIAPSSWSDVRGGDYESFYARVADSILRGAGITEGSGELATRYPPGFSIYLAGVFFITRPSGVPDPAAIQYAAAVGLGISAVLVLKLSSLIWPLRGALAAGLCWATYPFALFLVLKPASEVPFLVVVYSALLLYARALRNRSGSTGVFVAIGCLMGAASLIRPIAAGLGATMAGFTVLWPSFGAMRLRAVAGLALLAGNLLAVLPWELLAYAKTGQVILLSTYGIRGIRDGLTFAVLNKGYRESKPLPHDVLTVMNNVRVRYPELESIGGVANVLKDEFQRDPGALLKLYAVKAARSWYATDSGRLESAVFLIQLPYLALAVFGGIRGWRINGHAAALIMLTCVLTAYFWAMTVMFLSIARYLVPCMGLLFVMIPAVWARSSSLQTESEGVASGAVPA